MRDEHLGHIIFIRAKSSDFEFLQVIGKGSFGKVYQALHRYEGKIYAIKVLSKEAILKRNEVKHIMAERNVLKGNFDHPFLVGLHYSFQSKDKLYFVLDFINGGEVNMTINIYQSLLIKLIINLHFEAFLSLVPTEAISRAESEILCR
jgi:serine/threonine protein kinase